MNRRSVLGWLQGVVLTGAIILSGGTLANADELAFADGAKTFITNLTGEAITSLTAADIDKYERRKRFRSLMHEKFAFASIAKWVLGRYWRKAKADEREQFMELFEDLMVVTYADRFENYSGGKIDITKAEVRGGKDALVHSRLIREENVKPVDVIWRVRKSGEVFKIVDVMVAGLSMGLTQQKEFASVIRKNGGKVSGLLDELRKRLKSNT
jgi:phospholipid transport system substrate-binding protein